MRVQEEREQQAAVITGAPRRIVHGNFFVGNLVRSMDFYTGVAGIEETWRMSERPAGFISNGNTHHDMGLVEVGPHTAGRGARAHEKGVMEIPDDYGSHPGLNHFAYEMKHEADLVAAYERAIQAGVKMMMVEDRVVTRSIYYSDPEGNGVELTVDMLTNWREHRRPGAKVEHVEYVPGETPPVTESFYAEDPEIRWVEGAAVHPRRFAHATLVATDFDTVLRFYRDVVGFEEAYKAPDGRFSLLGGDYLGYSLALFPAEANRPAGVHHIAFELTDRGDFDEVESRLSSMGVQLELRIEHAGRRAIFVKDPDGVLVQFYLDEQDFAVALGELDTGIAVYLS